MGGCRMLGILNLFSKWEGSPMRAASLHVSSECAGRKRWVRTTAFEGLESRQLMSATPLGAAKLERILSSLGQSAVSPAASAGLQTSGFSALDLIHAYGLDRLRFGPSAADGRGQTVAIIVRGDDPNIGTELSYYDSFWGLAAANLQVIKETYNGVAPTTADSSWLFETAMDVELIHSFAPQAKILLYEA